MGEGFLLGVQICLLLSAPLNVVALAPNAPCRPCLFLKQACVPAELNSERGGWGGTLMLKEHRTRGRFPVPSHGDAAMLGVKEQGQQAL